MCLPFLRSQRARARLVVRPIQLWTEGVQNRGCYSLALLRSRSLSADPCLTEPNRHAVSILHGRDDVEAIDCSLAQSLSSLRNIHLKGVTTEEGFRDMGLGGFEVGTADEGKAALPTPGGASRTITLENRLEFVAMAEAFKMREFWVPVRWANLFCRE